MNLVVYFYLVYHEMYSTFHVAVIKKRFNNFILESITDNV